MTCPKGKGIHAAVNNVILQCSAVLTDSRQLHIVCATFEELPDLHGLILDLIVTDLPPLMFSHYRDSKSCLKILKSFFFFVFNPAVSFCLCHGFRYLTALEDKFLKSHGFIKAIQKFLDCISVSLGYKIQKKKKVLANYLIV